MHDVLMPWRPSREDPWDYDAALHLMRRAGFSAPPAEVEALLGLAPAAAVELLVAGPAEDPVAAEMDAILESVLGTGDADAARAWLVTRMRRSHHPLREKMALFWHGHFATSIAKVRNLSWMMRQYRIFLDHGLGRFPALLDAVTKDPAMIRWLDNETNAKGHPNENYARELLELFTLGEGNYTEKDVQEAGRAFTGWHILRDRFHFAALLHDEGEKTVLGETGAFGGEEVCRIALEQEACGRFLAYKLLRFFVKAEPREDEVEALGEAVRNHGYDMSATLRVLLGSRLFFSRGVRRELIKSPLEFLIGALRTFDASVKTKRIVRLAREMGQDLLAPPNVKGWPGHRDWINTATWLTRVNAGGLVAGAARCKGSLDELARALFGRSIPVALRSEIAAGSRGTRDQVHALLSLPEAQLA